MGAGARRRALRRRAEDADEARDAARYYLDLAERWAGPARGRTAEAYGDSVWAQDLARSAYRQAKLLEFGPASLRNLQRLGRVQADVHAAVDECVRRLHESGMS